MQRRTQFEQQQAQLARQGVAAADDAKAYEKLKKKMSQVREQR